MERVRNAYGAQAELYIDLFGTAAQVDPDDLAFIARHLSIQHGAVLDVGCGPGHLTEFLRSQDVDATGIDLVPAFIEHARCAYPDGNDEIASMDRLPVADRSVTGILAWYSLIHLPPNALDRVLAELRRATVPTGVLVAGFYDGDEVTAFEHKVVTAWFWPVDEFSERLRRAGFNEVERFWRPAQDGRSAQQGHRAHAAIAGIAV